MTWDISDHLLDDPRTKEELDNIKAAVIAREGEPEAKITCDGCAQAPVCKLYWNPYNTNGACLLEK